MELKEFIKQSVSAIAEASAELQDELGKDGHVINPPTSSSDKQNFGRSKDFRYRRVEDIEFDVMVTAESGASGEAKARISVLSVKFGAEGQVKKRSESVNCLRFLIPLALKPSKEYKENVELFEKDLGKQQQSAEQDQQPLGDYNRGVP